MNALELFERLAPLVAPMLEAKLERRDLCVLSTACVIDVARYFEIEVRPVSVKLLVYNASFAAHIVDGQWTGGDVLKLADGSWSVGIGFDAEAEPGKWPGHLIAASNGTFGDFSIRQAERLERGIVTGPAIVGPMWVRPGDMWFCRNNAGTTAEYRLSDNDGWRRGRDWRDRWRRNRIVGALIRAIR